MYMRPLTRYILFLFVVLFTSCGTVRRSAVSRGEEVVLSVAEQRKYEYYFLEALKLERLERYDEAFEMFQHCLSISPTAPSTQAKLVNYYFAFGEKEKALEALLCAVKGAPDNYWYNQTLAAYYQNSQEYDKAIAVIEQMQQRFPKRNGELLPALVGLYGRTEQYDKVIDVLTRLEVIAGKSEAISMEKMRNYLLLGDAEKAFGEMEALVAEYPDDAYYRVILAEVYMDHGRALEAERILHDILAEEPNNGPAKISLAECYKSQADTVRYLAMTDSVMMSEEVSEELKARVITQLISEKADSAWVMDLFERAVALPQQTAKLGHLFAQYMLYLQQPEERVRPILLRILEIEPDHVAARVQMLSYAIEREDVVEMINICTEGIDYNPEVLEFYFYKGLGLSFLWRLDEALETYQQAVRQVGEDSEPEIVVGIYAEMGNLLQAQGRDEEAFASYESALKYNPSNIVVLNNYAYQLAVTGIELEKAEQMSRCAIEAEPENATYLDTYAWVLYKMQRYEEAVAYIERAMEADTNPSDVLYEHAGDIYHGMGDVARAQDYWRKALEIQRAGERVDKNLEKKIKGAK